MKRKILIATVGLIVLAVGYGLAVPTGTICRDYGIEIDCSGPGGSYIFDNMVQAETFYAAQQPALVVQQPETPPTYQFVVGGSTTTLSP